MLNFVRFLAMACLVFSGVLSDAIESSMSPDSDVQSLASSFRFLGITKTMATTTTVARLQTVYVHVTCLVKFPNVEPCVNNPPPTTPAPITTIKPTTTTVRTTTTKATTTTAKPWIQIIPGSSRPVLTGAVTINKVEPPTFQVNLPEFLGGGGNKNVVLTTGGSKDPGSNLLGGNNGLNVLFNKTGLNINLGGGVAASISGAGRRRRRSFLVEESAIQPSAVKQMEITASPELLRSDAIQQDVIVETSLDTEYQEYAIVGLDDISERAMPSFVKKRITIIKLDRVTVTTVRTVTSAYPTTSPNDRVTVGYMGCIPADAPTNLPLCNP